MFIPFVIQLQLRVCTTFRYIILSVKCAVGKMYINLRTQTASNYQIEKQPIKNSKEQVFSFVIICVRKMYVVVVVVVVMVI